MLSSARWVSAVLTFARGAVPIFADVLTFLLLCFRSPAAVAAENLFLRTHSSLGPGTPDQSSPKAELQIERHRIPKGCYIVSVSILGGLHHEYRLEKTPA